MQLSDSFNNDIGHATLGLARQEAQKSLVHHFIMVEFVYPTKSSNHRAVGQTSSSLNPCSSPSADDPRQIHLSSEKTFKVSCEESLTSFYTSLKFLFLFFSKPQNLQNQFYKSHTHSRTEKTWKYHWIDRHWTRRATS